MQNKKAALGSFIATFGATIAIFIILVIFIIGSSLVKNFSNIKSGVSVPDEDKIGMGGINQYAGEFKVLQLIKLNVSSGEKENLFKNYFIEINKLRQKAKPFISAASPEWDDYGGFGSQ